ncbi:membrane protein insertion efficiency factor YidD [Oryzomonas japonica]|uniref:Putative membrane protein insertion efficiency factor n=3 Tax=Oryzomonas TaxID=2855184 RepID=A0A5A9XAP3_9BACT|nr:MULTISPECIES: membrane protein insertion efficiency factor YidD [Oryzomonas]KAA0889713.1 membrane protein insertion efficiency factor YidD [Oryzomonas rubra]KAB0667156.1 membrane protein insertion efficiency factor YidD [Oryzomonas japonica]KAB0671614.1 membrane protein insertion efficiency factor YidD [Oryzomonas sagensis]
MLKRIALIVIRLYQKLLSPLLPQTCRFYPSCSEYSRESIIRYGVVRGVWLTLIRLCKCHPFHPGGFDPVP